MLLEAFGGWLTHSLALLSDAGHMFSDAFSLGVALWAFKLGEKETTLQKTFGYKRFEILTAMFNGLSLGGYRRPDFLRSHQTPALSARNRHAGNACYQRRRSAGQHRRGGLYAEKQRHPKPTSTCAARICTF